jgi:hypothetical protein
LVLLSSGLSYRLQKNADCLGSPVLRPQLPSSEECRRGSETLHCYSLFSVLPLASFTYTHIRRSGLIKFCEIL